MIHQKHISERKKYLISSSKFRSEDGDSLKAEKKKINSFWSCRSLSIIICSAVVFVIFIIYLTASRYSISMRNDVNYFNVKIPCRFSHDVSPVVASILCAVEEKRWFIAKEYQDKFSDKCFIGNPHRCTSVLQVPTEDMVKPEKTTHRGAKSQKYNNLALIAESLIPKTWFRLGFRDRDLLLSRGDGTDLKESLLNDKIPENKNLEYTYNCFHSPSNLHYSFSFLSSKSSKALPLNDPDCGAKNPAILEFWSLWNQERLFGGEYGKDNTWQPRLGQGKKLRAAAEKALMSVLSTYGKAKDGCERIIHSDSCKGVIAAAALVTTIHNLAHLIRFDASDKSKQENLEHDILIGYMLSSLGRAVLHGETATTGREGLTMYNVKLADFVALQAAYLQLYIDSIGSLYSKQLSAHIPIAFPPSFTVTSRPDWRPLADKLEPITMNLRNMMFTMDGSRTDFGPYRPLISFPAARKQVEDTRKRRVLIDVGAPGFFASPKYLLDSYAIYLPFTHAVVVEPNPTFMQEVPDVYRKRYDIKHLNIYAEVGTNSKEDLVSLLPTLVTPEDFVVLKFDVDSNHLATGATMEWGFLYSLMQNPQTALLIDELYISLHYHFPGISWYHFHSNWEALDCLRYLREKGMIVHAWP